MRGMRMLFVGFAMVALAAAPAVAQSTRPSTPPPQAGTVQMPRPGAMAGSTVGIRLSDVSADQVKSLKLSKAEGAIVESVNPDSPASAAGIRAKDVVVEFDGERVRSARHLTRLVSETPAGRDVEMVLMRDGRKTELHIKPEARSLAGWSIRSRCANGASRWGRPRARWPRARCREIFPRWPASTAADGWACRFRSSRPSWPTILA